MPVKWTAVEVLRGRPFSVASDVWSFGIVCWEVMENGEKPYAYYNNKEALENIKKGERLKKPNNECPPLLWEMMQKCWSLEPKERPSFDEVI